MVIAERKATNCAQFIYIYQYIYYKYVYQNGSIWLHIQNGCLPQTSTLYHQCLLQTHECSLGSRTAEADGGGEGCWLSALLLHSPLFS